MLKKDCFWKELALCLVIIVLIISSAKTTFAEEFQINNITNGDQKAPSVSALSNGGFVVVWQSKTYVYGSTEIYGQIFDNEGVKIGNEFQVNSYTDSTQDKPSVSGLSNGGFVVLWESQGQDGSEDGIFGQIFDSSGNKVGAEFIVNTYTNLYQRYQSVAGHPNGGFLATWTSGDYAIPEDDVYGQIFDGLGNKVGVEFRINTYSDWKQLDTSVAVLSNGNFMVVWESGYGGPIVGWEVRGQIFDSIGNKVGNEFVIKKFYRSTEYGAPWSDHKNPSVVGLPDGRFVVVWQSYYSNTDSFFNVYGQIFDITGNKVGNEFQVNTFTRNDEENPSVAVLTNKSFIVVWHSKIDDVYGQLINNIGNKVNDEFRINSYTDYAQNYPSVSALSGDRYVVVWQSYNQDGEENGIFGKILKVDPQLVSTKAMPWIPLLLLDE